MSGNLTAVSEMSGILLKVGEVSGKKSGKSGLRLFIVSCIFASILDFSEFLHFVLVPLHCCIPTPTADHNASTGMIGVTLNVGRSAANRQGNAMELSENFT